MSKNNDSSGQDTKRPAGKGYQNRLIQEKSPYLLQHAHNPVDWYPWGPDAFAKAKKENKPIFLSVGYSTCHWCHVMEEESFADPEIGKLLNDVFVCIKVDREERPDIDTLFMNVCQLITGSGGWPLTIIMTPDRKPFFAGTYIPKSSRYGTLGIADLIKRIQHLWTAKHQEIMESADQITDVLRQGLPVPRGEELGREDLDLAYVNLEQTFDYEYGGFGDSMKFPTAHTLSFLLRYWKRTGTSKALVMVEQTLKAMRSGGIFDHLGFGFHRYTTDREWLIPHYEKMLYDQAMIAMIYLEAYQATEKETYAQTVRSIMTYVFNQLTSPHGAFYCAQDADTEGEEGKFYLWTSEQIRESLSKGKADFACSVFDIQEEGNFVEQMAGQRVGQNILHMPKTISELAGEMNVSESIVLKHIDDIRNKLLAEREKRPRPYTDDKILTDWNGLMIASLARAGSVLNDVQYIQAAEKAFGFILHHLRQSDGTLLHRFRDHESAVHGFLNDYVFLTWAAIELYEATFKADYLEIALHLTEQTLNDFWDAKDGGFYLTGKDSNDLVVRTKDLYDGAIPAGSSVAMMNLLRLSRMTGNTKYEDKAYQTQRSVAHIVRKAPFGYTQLLLAIDFAVGPTHEVVITGNSNAKDTRQMLQALYSKYIPNKVVIFRPAEEKSPPIMRLAKFTEPYKPLDSRATAYVCRDFSCQPPTEDIHEMLELLEAETGVK